MSDALPLSPLTYGELAERASEAAFATVGSVHQWNIDGRVCELIAVEYAAACVAYQDALAVRLTREVRP